MRSLTLAALVSSFAPFALTAQAPTPPPEAAKLGYFEGTWKLEGEDQKGPFGPGGKTTGTEKCEWFEGRFAVVCRADIMTPGGKGKSMSTFTYNAAKKSYSFDGIDSFGADISASGELTGGAWHWTSVPMHMPDGVYNIRYSVTPVSDREYTYTWTYAKKGIAWQSGGKGRGTKK